MSLQEMMSEIVANRKSACAPRGIIVGHSDDDEMRKGLSVPLKTVDGENRSFMIEYVDSKGDFSARRITINRLEVDESNVVVHAFCHERKAQRTFIMSRISSIIDFDGVVHDDVAAFIAENFGNQIRSIAEKHASEKEWDTFKSCVIPDIDILLAVSIADGKKSKNETEVIIDIGVKLAADDGIHLDQENEKRFQGYVKRVRPDFDAIDRACRIVFERKKSRNVKLLNAVVKVMDADGKRDDEEISFLERFCKYITGMPLSHFAKKPRPESVLHMN